MYHYRQKAEKKGAVFQKDIEYKYVIKTDTLIKTVKGEDVQHIVYRIDSIPYETESLVYVPMSRQERLHLRDQMKFQAKMYKDSLKNQNRNHRREINAYEDSLRFEKQKHKSDNRLERSKNRWWLWFILGNGCGGFLIFLIMKRLGLVKNS